MRRVFRVILVLMVGYYITEWWLNQQQQGKTVPAKTTPEPAKRTPPPPKSTPDPLTEIDGIGPAFERALNAIGIKTFEQLAEQDVDQLAAKLTGVRITSARIKKDRWIEQAADRAASPASVSSRWSANDGKSS